jgi:acyl-coenzyme A synthetase/AMP-(fatty) acid ligase
VNVSEIEKVVDGVMSGNALGVTTQEVAQNCDTDVASHDFGWALRRLREGKLVTRLSWGGMVLKYDEDKEEFLMGYLTFSHWWVGHEDLLAEDYVLANEPSIQ